MFICRIIQLCRGEHQLKGFLPLPFRQSQPGGGGAAVDFDLLSPVIVAFDFRERLPDRGQLFDFLTR